ncbi:MAG TPA: nucleoside-diphosphate kinase [Gemmatimonadales bacterium]|nr:nucleoside-diphosphate kinase [Gemmatimonadales bacterium]
MNGERGMSMAGKQTLGIVKPDAVAGGKLGAIVAHLEREGYQVRAARLVRLSRAQAEAFYEVHRGRPFYEELVRFMSSGPCLPMALEKEGAVAAFRASIGATDPAEAAPGTIRKLYAESKGKNAVHGSDSDENAAREIAFFFSESERAGLWG